MSHWNRSTKSLIFVFQASSSCAITFKMGLGPLLWAQDKDSKLILFGTPWLILYSRLHYNLKSLTKVSPQKFISPTASLTQGIIKIENCISFLLRHPTRFNLLKLPTRKWTLSQATVSDKFLPLIMEVHCFFISKQQVISLLYRQTKQCVITRSEYRWCKPRCSKTLTHHACFEYISVLNGSFIRL